MHLIRTLLTCLILARILQAAPPPPAAKADKKPNIVHMMTDDQTRAAIGILNPEITAPATATILTATNSVDVDAVVYENPKGDLITALGLVPQPNAIKGVILVLIDDIGYGDFDILHPSSLETPHMDTLAMESVRFTDFHVGSTCSPTRGSLMSGRNINAAGVWHTFAGRSLLREDEQTVADVFKANGWSTGIFGKWHLGDNYPFLPRYRGFDVEVIHGGGGVSQMPDYWGNDYYSSVDDQGNPTTADVYFENGEEFTADEFCTDFWFTRARQFMQASLAEGGPFFCYIPLNAAHAPFHAPHGYKSGFDGLIENIDDNMGWLNDFLVAEGIRDDVLLILTTDNGTAKSRLGGLRGKKGSHYDGGHNVPCFWRWKNGGIAGSSTLDRDVSPLTAAADFMPTMIDLLGLTKPPGGKPLDGISLREMLTNPAYVPQERTWVVDTQRAAHLVKWKNAAILKDEVAEGQITRKWRLVRNSSSAGFQVYDFLLDRDQSNNTAGSHGDIITELSSVYNTWWDQVSAGQAPYAPSVIGVETETTLFSHDWIGDGTTPLSQGSINNAVSGTRTSSVRFDRSDRYRFELRRWPREDGGAINGKNSSGGGAALNGVTRSRLSIAGVGEWIQAVQPGDAFSAIEVAVPAADQTTLTSAFLNSDDNVQSGAYYIYVYTGSLSDTDGDGLSDMFEQQIIDADPDDGISTMDDVLPGADFDGDGLNNEEEQTAGTDPTSTSSVFEIAGHDLLADNANVTFSTVLGRTYMVFWSTEMKNWTLHSTHGGTGAEISPLIDMAAIDLEDDGVSRNLNRLFIRIEVRR